MKNILSIVLALLVALVLQGCNNNDLVEENKSMSKEEKLERIEEMYAEIREDLTEIEDVTPAEIAEAYKKDEIIIVDVRDPDEQAISMIPGALTKDVFEQKRKDGTLEDKPVVMHCTIGYRSGKYAQSVNEQGIDAKNLKGSLLLWTHEGLPLEKAGGTPTKEVHVYGEKWDLIPEGYVGVKKK
jgi:rhodanese-related sulfurtransferase